MPEVLETCGEIRELSGESNKFSSYYHRSLSRLRKLR